MDDLISKFEKLETTEINDLISKIKFVNINQESQRINENYLKLLNLRNYSYSEPFMLFMEKIDTVNKYYIENIDNYDIASINELIELIKELLISSINCTNSYDKVDYILTAYSNIQFIIKNMNME